MPDRHFNGSMFKTEHQISLLSNLFYPSLPQFKENNLPISKSKTLRIIQDTFLMFHIQYLRNTDGSTFKILESDHLLTHTAAIFIQAIIIFRSLDYFNNFLIIWF